MTSFRLFILLPAILLAIFHTHRTFAFSGGGPVAMFGADTTRNMVSQAKNLPDSWDPDSGENILWKVDLGNETYAGPVVTPTQVFVGTNNENPRDKSLTGDRGVVMAFDRKTGKFLWQSTHEKLEEGMTYDWPHQGVCSTPMVEGNRVYYLSNRCEVMALDTAGFTDGDNAGPFNNEAGTGPNAADIVWRLDMKETLGVRPFNMTASSPLIVDDLLYTLTSNGRTKNNQVEAPKAPSFLAIDKKTGKVAWQSNAPGDRIVDGQWSNPSYGVIQGKQAVLFPGGDGWLYAFEPKTGKQLWKFNCNPTAGEAEPEPASIVASPVIYDNKVYIGIGRNPEHGALPGMLWAIAPQGSGDISGKGVVWKRGGEDFSFTLSTVAIADGLVYAVDLNGIFVVLDANTGKEVWQHDTFANVWSSPLVADGKVYLTTEDGDVLAFKAGREKKELLQINMGDAIYTTPAAQDGVLYIATRSQLFAIGE